MSESKELMLPVAQRVAIAFKSEERAKQLTELAAKHKDITVITNDAGREQVHRAYMTLKTARVEVEKEGKGLRDDANKYRDGVIAEEKRLIALVSVEEDRLEALRDAWDKIEKDRLAAIAAKEQERKDAIRARISAIQQSPLTMAAASAELVGKAIAKLEGLATNDGQFEEFVAEAGMVKEATLAQLRELFNQRQEFEAAQEKLRLDAIAAAEQKAKQEAEAAVAAKIQAEKAAAERAELAKLLAEQAAREKAEQERQAEIARREREQLDRERAQQEAAAKAERDRIAAEEAAARKRIEDQQREADRLRKEADDKARREREAAEAELRRQQDALAAERKAAELKAQQERTAAQNAEREIIVHFVMDKFQISEPAADAKCRELFR